MLSSVAIIGFGNMGQAIYKGVADRIGPEHVFVADTNMDKLSSLPLGRAFTDIIHPVSSADIILLCVKPQSFEELAPSFSSSLNGKLIISIMAGISLACLQKVLQTSRIVRAMPNIAAKKAQSLTAWVATSDAILYAKEIEMILDSFGSSLRLEREEQMDSFTALSGSGPAYFYLLCELLEKKALEYGFSLDNARRIAVHTMTGAASLFEKNGKAPADLRSSVTSKGGTTQAAIEHLEQNGFEEMFLEALEKARKRAEELGQSKI